MKKDIIILDATSKGLIPPSLVRWGTVIIVAIFLILLLVVCFMPYPHSQGESILQRLFIM